HAEVRERTREIGVMRAVGATRVDVATLILAEAAVTGIVGGAFGVALARIGGVAIDYLARKWLPEFPFKPQTFFDFRPTHVLLGIEAESFRWSARASERIRRCDRIRSSPSRRTDGPSHP